MYIQFDESFLRDIFALSPCKCLANWINLWLRDHWTSDDLFVFAKLPVNFDCESNEQQT